MLLNLKIVDLKNLLRRDRFEQKKEAVFRQPLFNSCIVYGYCITIISWAFLVPLYPVYNSKCHLLLASIQQ
jgi:hypothetical protein